MPNTYTLSVLRKTLLPTLLGTTMRYLPEQGRVIGGPRTTYGFDAVAADLPGRTAACAEPHSNIQVQEILLIQRVLGTPDSAESEAEGFCHETDRLNGPAPMLVRSGGCCRASKTIAAFVPVGE